MGPAAVYAPMAKSRGDDSMAFYELRQYFVRPGKMDEWVKIMEEEIIPCQVSKGMVICGSFRGETDDTHYVCIRRFDSEAQREALYKAVYETDHWKTKIAPRVPECLDREKNVITRIVPTPKSTVQQRARRPPSPAVTLSLPGPAAAAAGARGRVPWCPSAFAAAVICLPREDSAAGSPPRDWSYEYLASIRVNVACCCPRDAGAAGAGGIAVPDGASVAAGAAAMIEDIMSPLGMR